MDVSIRDDGGNFNYRVCAVMTDHDKILAMRDERSPFYYLPGGRVKLGETAEKAVTREFKEETQLNTVKYKFMSSRYHEPRNVLMLNFLTMAENGEPAIDEEEIDEVRWFTFDEALGAVRKDSTAEFFLKNAIAELKKNAF